MTPCHVPVCPAHPAVQVTRTRRGVEEQVSYVNFGSPPPSPRLPCRHCHMTFVNEQGLGIHVKTMHSTANMYKGMRLRRMLGKGDGGRILPWEHAGPGHCWRVTFDHTTGGASFVLQPKRYKDVDLESDGFTVAAKVLTQVNDKKKWNSGNKNIVVYTAVQYLLLYCAAYSTAQHYGACRHAVLK